MPQLRPSAMVDYHYDDNVHKRAVKKRRVRFFLWFLAALILIIAGWIIFDGLRTKETITNNVSETGTLAQTVERAVFETEKFRFTADTTWQEAPSVEDGYRNFRYQSMDNGLVKRELRIYQDRVPEDLALTHVNEVEVVNNKIVPLGISPKCSELQPDKKNKRDIELNWGGVDFICDPDLNAYIVGTSHNKDGYATYVAGPETTGRYFFVYRDLEATPRLEIFNNLLETFEAK